MLKIVFFYHIFFIYMNLVDESSYIIIPGFDVYLVKL